MLVALCGSFASSLSSPQAASAREFSNGVHSLVPVAGNVADVAEAPDGSIVFAHGRRVTRQALDGSRTTVARSDGRMGMSVSHDGSILVADGPAQQIRRVTSDGTVTPVAGTGQMGFAGDGGPATQAELWILGVSPYVLGLTEAADGGLLFADRGNLRVRRVRPDGIIETVAGSSPPVGSGPVVGSLDDATRRDGGPATMARFGSLEDVLATPDGGFLVADSADRRVRKVRPDGTIITFAGGGSGRFGSGDGGPAARASFAGPIGLAALPDGAVAISDALTLDIRAVGSDGIVRSLVDRDSLSRKPGRLGDFAGRRLFGLAVASTAEHGLLVGGHRGLYYLPPPGTSRTLVALRDARASARAVTVDVEATQPGTARLELRRQGRVVAATTSAIGAGRQTLIVRGRFAPVEHEVDISLTSAGGATASDQVGLFPVTSLKPLMRTILRRLRALGELVDDTASYAWNGIPPSACHRYSARRVDCVLRNEVPGEDSCDGVFAFTLPPSGILFVRDYDCARSPRSPFRRHPRWNARATPPGQWRFVDVP